jgi:hypothetical protein
VTLSDQLEIGGIEAHARVRKANGELTKSTKGTTVAYIKVGDESYDVPDPGETLEIPGLARIEVNKQYPGKYGIRVVAVEVTLLEGSPAQSVVNRGEAFARIRPE